MLVAEQNTSVRDVEVAVVDLRIFDQLFSAQEVLQRARPLRSERR